MKNRILVLLSVMFAFNALGCEKVDPLVNTSLNDELLTLLEEEKVALNLYQEFYKKYQKQVFENISFSEAHHFEMMTGLVEENGGIVPLSIFQNEPGIYNSERLQSLYNGLLEKGSASLEQALIAGATVEELDLIDLKEMLNNSELKDPLLIIEKLINATENHLKAFVRNLEAINVVYTPQYLDLEAYNMILAKKGNSCTDGEKNKNCCTSKKNGKNGNCCEGNKKSSCKS